MKIKSVSDNNLGNIVKEMINTALKDSNQIAKLHQAIYEEWYFKKMMELKDTRSRMQNEISSSPSCNLTRNISNGANSMDASNEIKYLPKQNLDNIRIDCNKSDERDTSVICNKSVKTNVHMKHNEKPYKISEDQEYINSSNIAPSMKITEVWHYPTQREKARKKLESNITEQKNREQNEGKLTKQMRRKLSFESWKKGKNLMYRRLLKEVEEEKQRELQKKLKDIKCKKASKEVYAQIIKEKEAQERRELKQLQMIQQINIEILQKQNDERCIINDQAFNIWKRQKDIKLKEAKLMTMENASYHRLKRLMGPTTQRPSTQFDLWLDQLNNISCKRYLWKHHII